MAEPRLFEVRLPAGDVQGWQIDYESNTGARKVWSDEWLSQGYDGVRYIGAGRGVTRIRPGGSWDTLAVERHPGIVQLEALSVHCARSTAIRFGISRREKPLIPSFRLIGRDVEIVADDPEDHRASGTWGLFSYMADIDMEGCLWDCAHLLEHANYHHGFAKTGLRWKSNEVLASGAECLKMRPDPTETFATPKARALVEDSKFKNWYQPWSSRGGGGIVAQGIGIPLTVRRCEFWAPLQDASHTRCLMIDDNGGAFWSSVTGSLSSGYATGAVLIEDSGFRAGIGTENYSLAIRVGPLGSWQKVARSFTIRRCGIYGDHTQIQLVGVQPGHVLIETSNTPAIRSIAASVGMDVSMETMIPTAQRLVPVSEGLSR